MSRNFRRRLGDERSTLTSVQPQSAGSGFGDANPVGEGPGSVEGEDRAAPGLRGRSPLVNCVSTPVLSYRNGSGLR